MPPSGRCWVASMIAQTDPDVPAARLDKAAAAAWDPCRLTHIPGSPQEHARIAAHVGARSARIMLIPGEPVYGMRLSAKKPGTIDEDYEYALLRQVRRFWYVLCIAWTFWSRNQVVTCIQSVFKNAPCVL